jgi:coenzyme F420-reducing hydrogenase delta subunit
MTKIVGYVCEWGGYAAADLAGFRGIRYTPDLRMIRVECTGRIDPVWLLDAVVEGASGAIVVGCTEGDSRHEIGNFRAHERVRWVQQGLTMIGEQPQRVRALFISSEDAEGFAEAIEGFKQDLDSYGPVGRGEEELERLQALREVFAAERTRWLIGRGPDIVADGDAFGDPVTSEDFDSAVAAILLSEYTRVRILRNLRNESRTVSDVASQLGLPTRDVMTEISDLIGMGRVAIDGHQAPPVFKEVVR